MSMRAAVDTIATHTGLGAGTSHKLGKDGLPGTNTDDIGSPIRHIQISGTFTATLILEGSLDGTTWTEWVGGITAPDYYIIPDGPLFLRSKCTAYTNGTATVKAQKFIEA